MDEDSKKSVMENPPASEEEEPDDDMRKVAYDIIQSLGGNLGLLRNSGEGSPSENTRATSSTCTCTRRDRVRPPVVTLVPVQVDGRIEILAVPPICVDCSKLVKPDKLHYSKSPSAEGVGESNVRRQQSGEVVEDKAKRTGNFSESSSVQNSAQSNLSTFLPRELNFGSTSSDASKKDKQLRKNLKKRWKKKGKHKGGRASTRGASKSDVTSGSGVPETLTSERCDDSSMVQAGVSVSGSQGAPSHCVQKSCGEDMSSAGSSGISYPDEKSHLEQEDEYADLQESITRQTYSSYPTWSDGIMYIMGQPEETMDTSQESHGTEMQWNLVGKRGRLNKKVPKKPLCCNNEKSQISDCNPVPQQASGGYSDACEEDLEILPIDEACSFQLKLEALRIATGDPVAEFEKLLNLFSPVICRPLSTASCMVTGNQAAGSHLCRDETANCSLNDLWEWYDSPGSFGVAIKSLTNDSTLNAHFSPSLSAMQLFRKVVEETPGKQPGYDTLHHIDQSCGSDSCGDFTLSSRFVSAENQCQQGYELLFEFFESELPYMRRTFFDKIQHLVKCEGCSHCKYYGDPTHLQSMKLHDLHPRSWYAVAWYPICTIPNDRKSASAFLTYHSLGHLVDRSVSCTTTVESFITSPVVGFQSYKIKGNCWFHPRPSELEDRLKRLEETACLMARAVVKKGEMTSANRHDDFEFFFSRRLS